jgi:hypothetical protein
MAESKLQPEKDVMYNYPIKLKKLFKDTPINLVLKDNEYYVAPSDISAALKYSPLSTSVVASSIDYCDSIRHEYKLYVRVSAVIKLLSRLKNVPNVIHLRLWLKVNCDQRSAIKDALINSNDVHQLKQILINSLKHLDQTYPL